MQDREREGKHFTILIGAEEAREKGGGYVASSAGPDREARLGGVGQIVTAEIERRTALGGEAIAMRSFV